MLFRSPPGIPPPGFSPPPGIVPPGVGVPPIPGASSVSPPPGVPGAPAPPGAPTFVPSTSAPAQATPSTQTQPQQTASTVPPTPLVLPNPSLAQVNPTFKKDTVLKWSDPNFSPVSLYDCSHSLLYNSRLSQEEKRSRHPKYFFPVSTDGPVPNVPAEEMRGKKRARAEDFL